MEKTFEISQFSECTKNVSMESSSDDEYAFSVKSNSKRNARYVKLKAKEIIFDLSLTQELMLTLCVLMYTNPLM